MSALLATCLINAQGQIIATADTVRPDHFSNGLPFEADGSLAVQPASAVRFHQGIGFTDTSRIAVSGDTVLYFGSGAAGFQINRRLCRNLGFPVQYSSGLGYNVDAKVCQT